MKKSSPLILLLCLALLTSGFSLKEWRNSLYDTVKGQAEGSFSALFNRPVSIESAGGLIVGRIELNKMVIPGLGRADKVVLTYNPVAYALARGDMVPALTKITVIKGDFLIERDKNGTFTVLDAFTGRDNKNAGPPPFHGLVVLQDCTAEYIDQRGFKERPEYFSVSGRQINGSLDLRGKDKIKFSVSGRVPEFVKAQGSFFPASGKYELNVAAKNLGLKKWANYTVPLPGMQAQGGTADLNLRVGPPKTENWAASLTGQFSFHGAAAKFMGYDLTAVSGDLFIDDENLALKNIAGRLNDLPLTVNGRFSDFTQRNLDLTILAGAYRGSLNARLSVSFSGARPLTVSGKMSGLDLAALAQQAPGVEGKADGNFELTGPLSEIKGKLSANLTRGLVFGQPINKISSAFRIVNNSFLLDDFTAASGQVAFRAAGTVTSDLVFDLRAEAAGFHLKGKGVFGEMAATLDNFRGRTRWKLDKDFLAQPLRNLAASGEVLLSGGRVGEQTFDEARGGIAIGGGRIELNEVRLRQGRSVIRLGGTTGLGVPTRLFLGTDSLDLADVKLFAPFLPEGAREATGTASFEIEVAGELSKETRLVSIDPLLDLTVNGRLEIEGAEIGGAPVDSALLNFYWHERALKISNTRILMPHSRWGLDLAYRRDGSLAGSLEGTADLDHYRTFTSRYGKISGLAGFGISLSGSLECPLAAASFWFEKFRYNDIFLDHIAGSAAYCVNDFYTLKPIIFRNGADQYSLDGHLVYDPATPEASQLNLDLKVLRADLASAYPLFYKLEGEIARQFFAASHNSAAVRIDTSAFRLPDPAAFAPGGKLELYHRNGKNSRYFLGAFAEVNQQAEKTLAAAPAENIGGRLTAEVTLSGKAGDLSGRLTAGISRGYFRDYEFDSFSARAALKDRSITLEKAILAKSGGALTARGRVDFDGRLSLSLTASKLPLDLMLAAFPGKEYRGAFDMSASIEGFLPNPDFTLSAAGKEISLAGVAFDEAGLALAKNRDYLYLRGLSLRQGKALSTAEGYLSLAHPGTVSIEASLKDNAIGLLNLFTDQVKWRGGNSELIARVTGTLDRPRISGRASVQNGLLRLNALESDLRDLRGSAVLENNVMTIKVLTGIFTGKRTNDLPDPVGLAGTVDLNRVLAAKPSLELDLAFSPTLMYLNFPNLYIGTLKVKTLALRGPLALDLSEGPLLAGSVEVSNSVITIGQPAGGRAFPLRLGLDVDLARNAYVAMGDVATLNLSNILMNLEVNGGLGISGSLEQPDLLGKIVIRRGTVNIFNREFSLLTAERLKKYSTYGSQIAQENFASFRGEGAQPALDITASVDVINQEKDASGNPVKKKVNVLAQLTGTLGAREESSALKIALSSFTEDTSRSPSEFVPAAYSEQDLKVMLLPDFIKSLAGIGQPGTSGNKVESNAVVADYLNSRVQSLLFRSLEREAEQTLGLESLTLEYNFGPKIGEALGVRDIKGFEQEKPAWSVGFVKGLFDRLYIDVRYAQGTDPTAPANNNQTTFFNYQLTYKLTSIWSIIYYREPNNLSNPATGYQKLTLRAGFYLW